MAIEPCVCGFVWGGERLPEQVCHHTSHGRDGGAEYIVICPRCRKDGELKATPRWAVEAWNLARASATTMTEQEYQAALQRLREEWGSVAVDPDQPGVLRAALDPFTGLLVGHRAALFAEIINRACHND